MLVAPEPPEKRPLVTARAASHAPRGPYLLTIPRLMAATIRIAITKIVQAAVLIPTPFRTDRFHDEPERKPRQRPSRSSSRTATVSPACLPIAFRISAFTGSL